MERANISVSSAVYVPTAMVEVVWYAPLLWTTFLLSAFEIL
jgi:hypothetical protein